MKNHLEHHTESEFTHHGPCESCGSSDANSYYTDSHSYCFACGTHKRAPGGSSNDTHKRAPGGSSNDTQEATEEPTSVSFRPTKGEVRALKKRGISEETCKLFGYTVGEDKDGNAIQLAPYCDSMGRIMAQKWRDAEKNFGVFGKLKDALPLFGQHLWRDKGKRVIITEGEIDAMSVSQAQGNKWPVVSVPNGSNGAKKALSKALEWLEGFEEIVLMFDMDAPGREAVEECASLFSIGKVKVAHLPLKDANEMLQAGLIKELIDAIWGAKDYRPDGIVTVDDVYEEACKDIEMGLPWFIKKLTEVTYGRRYGEIYALGAGTGIGKTDVFTQSIAFDILELKLKVGVIFLEQPPVETVRRVAGKVVGKRLHVPNAVTQEEKQEAIKILRDTNLMVMYNHFGAKDWETIKGKIRFMAISEGCKMIYLDHLTALVANEDDERKILDSIMADLASLALELNVCIHFISHLTRPKDGPGHELGGMVTQAQFRGSNAIGMWSHFMFGLERNTQAENPIERATTILRVIKDRNTGDATGVLIYLGYEKQTGLLYEHTSNPFEDSPNSQSTSTINKEKQNGKSKRKSLEDSPF